MAPTTRKNQQLLTTVSSVNDEIKCVDDNILILLNKLNEKIDKNHENICAKIDQQSINQQKELSKNLIEFETKMDDKVQRILSSHTSQVDKCMSVIETNERMSKLNDVILRGIPAKKNESLVIIFDQISSTIGFKAKRSAVNNIFRFGNEVNQSASSPLLVKFLSLILKREFMTNYFAHRELNLRAIGLDSTDRIFASDNLTKFNFDIQQKAVKMFKEKKISKVHTRSGLVYVKFNEHSEFVRIIHPNDLYVTNEISVKLD